ncbi:MAG: DUF998 domain-containing protein [Halobacterium sp.]
MNSSVRRLARGSGLAAIAVAFAGILAAAATDPGFSWVDGALSDLGVAADATALLFNYGLGLGGALGVPFAWWYWTAAETAAGRAAAVAFAAASVCMAGVGAFPSDTSLHAPVAVGFYLLGTYALALDATDAALAGDARRAVAWFWAALAHLTFWLAWLGVLAATNVEGIAVPETVGALAVAAWVVTTTRRTRPRRG